MMRVLFGAVCFVAVMFLGGCAHQFVNHTDTQVAGKLSEWAASCHSEYGRSVETLTPIGAASEIYEPVRLGPKEAIEKEAQSIIDDAIVCKANTDVDERTACIRVIEIRRQTNQQAALEAEQLESRNALFVGDAPLDKRRLEGRGDGPQTLRARREREALRRANRRNAAKWEEAESTRESCLSREPFPLNEGACPKGVGRVKEGICYPYPPAVIAPTNMSTKRAYRVGPARPVRVAFNNGTPVIRQAIRDVAEEWANATNGPIGFTTSGAPIFDPYRLEQPLKFDFGKETDNGFVFNTWSYDDTTFAAEIRIGFADDGYWSLIGTESIDPSIAHPGEASMNLEAFHGHTKLPADWRRIVFHEFGHALGLQHEHQHPISECGSALRLEDDEGYLLTLDGRNTAIADANGRRPGVLTFLENAPEYWSREAANFNLRQLKKSGDLDVTPFDPVSIMRYEFPAEWYRESAPVECLPTGKLATKPSRMDLAMVAKTYRKLMRASLK